MKESTCHLAVLCSNLCLLCLGLGSIRVCLSFQISKRLAFKVGLHKVQILATGTLSHGFVVVETEVWSDVLSVQPRGLGTERCFD